MRIFSKLPLVILTACGPKKAAPTPETPVDSAPVALATVHALDDVSALNCSSEVCHIETATGVVELKIDTMAFTELDRPPSPANESWPKTEQTKDFNTIWNTQVAKKWRSPFRVDIPAPSGGFYRATRGSGVGTSRVVRLGGSVVTARQGLEPGPIAYPRNLALHPTGTEAYHIVWPNPDLIAFNARTLQTTWRIRLDGPALGLFVSENGRYLLAELDGEAPEHQLLDYEPLDRTPPDGGDPWANPILQWLERPASKRTVLVDLALGEPVAIIPGSAVGLSLINNGAIVAASKGVAKVITEPR